MFKTYMHVPEKHPQTKDTFYEQKDDQGCLVQFNIIVYNILNIAYQGPSKLKLERYAEALNDTSSGLTYPAFVGSRKQCVTDAERLFSPKLAAFMEKKGYTFEAKYIKTVWNWRRASDERSLTSLQRCQFNYEFLNFMLEDLMPWYKESYDFILLEVMSFIDFLVEGI